MATASDKKTQLRHAIQFLVDHPGEAQATAARVYHVHERTLSNAIACSRVSQQRVNVQRGSQNKILIELQERVVYGFIRSYIKHNQLLARDVVYSVISRLRAEDRRAPLSQDWLTR